jgi:hypothetical protein
MVAPRVAELKDAEAVCSTGSAPLHTWMRLWVHWMLSWQMPSSWCLLQHQHVVVSSCHRIAHGQHCWMATC